MTENVRFIVDCCTMTPLVWLKPWTKQSTVKVLWSEDRTGCYWPIAPCGVDCLYKKTIRPSWRSRPLSSLLISGASSSTLKYQFTISRGVDYYFSFDNVLIEQFTLINRSLPDNVHLLTLEPWDQGRILMRLEHFYAVGEDSLLAKPVTVSIKVRRSTVKRCHLAYSLRSNATSNIDLDYLQFEGFVHYIRRAGCRASGSISQSKGGLVVIHHGVDLITHGNSNFAAQCRS